MPKTSTPSWHTAFQSRGDLKKYRDNALGLYALALRFGLEDIDSVAADSITDGNDDKKCDMVVIQYDAGIAVVAQCYQSRRNKSAAPANKASDLNTAVSWLLQRPIAELPERLRPHAEALRDAIADGTITQLEAWYVHNLPESKNVENELKTVEHTMTSAIEASFSNRRCKVRAHEIGNNRLDEWYQDTLSPILVSDTFQIPIEGGFEITTDAWAAFVTAVPATFLHSAYRKHKTRLFSANVRDYLGSRRSDANINFGIKDTAESDPNNFWAYNNGLTVLVHDFDHTVEKKGATLTIKGMSIVNGAQTTGALGSLKRLPDASVRVPVRFLKTTDDAIVHNVIQYNNSQNRVTASDFRSNDRIQKRLRAEIAQIPACEYQGGRRGGHADAITRQPNLIPSYTAGQALAAFTGEPNVGYHQKTAIWESDTLYSRFFNDHTTGAHLVFAFSLLRAVEARKVDLVAKSRSNQKAMTSSESRQLEFFRMRGSTLLFTAAIAGCLETVLGRRIPNPSRLSFGSSVSPESASRFWSPIISVVAPFCHQLSGAFENGLKSAPAIQNAISVFESLVESTRESNQQIFDTFKQKVVQTAK